MKHFVELCDCVVWETRARSDPWSFVRNVILGTVGVRMIRYCRLLPRISCSLRLSTYSIHICSVVRSFAGIFFIFIFLFFVVSSAFCSVHTENAQYFTTSNKIINGGTHTSCVRCTMYYMCNMLFSFCESCGICGLCARFTLPDTHSIGTAILKTFFAFTSSSNEEILSASSSSSYSFVCVIFCRVRMPGEGQSKD